MYIKAIKEYREFKKYWIALATYFRMKKKLILEKILQNKSSSDRMDWFYTKLVNQHCLDT